MSHIYFAYCVRCNKQSEEIGSNTDDMAREMVKEWPDSLGARDSVSFNVTARCAYLDPLVEFLGEHFDHEIVLADEYGKFQSIRCKGSTQRATAAEVLQSDLDAARQPGTMTVPADKVRIEANGVVSWVHPRT